MTEVVALSAEDWKQLVEAIENPKPPTPALIELMQGYRASQARGARDLGGRQTLA